MKKITKEIIIEEAFQLFSEKGYNNVSIVDICEKCGITKPTFYNHVTSKEELILDLYDRTIDHILKDSYKFLMADSHYEQLVLIFAALINDTQKFGSDLFSQMLISNLQEDHGSFSMRTTLTQTCELIIKKAQKQKEIHNMGEPARLYRALAHCFSGYELNWCIQNGNFAWAEDFFESMNLLLGVSPEFQVLYKKYL